MFLFWQILAKSPSKPENVKMDVKELTNFTTIHWEKPKMEKLQVIMFSCVKPILLLGKKKKFFTKENSIKLPYSKDNYFFAVQAVNSSGNESLIVIPKCKIIEKSRNFRDFFCVNFLNAKIIIAL